MPELERISQQVFQGRRRAHIVDKVVGGLATKVNDIVNGVLSKVQGAVGKVAAMGNKVMAAINVAKGGLSLVSKLKSLFSFDFSKMNWSSLISIILTGILVLEHERLG